MAFAEETRESVINQRLSEARTRHPQLTWITNRTNTFRDQSLFLNDPDTGGLIVFSKRDTFWEGSFGTFGTTDVPTVQYIQDFFQLGFDWATSNFSAAAFRAAYSIERCPWIIELSNRLSDFTVVTNCAQALNNISPGIVTVLDPPEQLSVELSDRTIDLGTVILRTATLPHEGL